MRKVISYKSLPCFLCGSLNTVTLDYLRLNSDDFRRNFAYWLPEVLASLFCKVSNRFASKYHPVEVNKKYFNRSAVYCKNCHTGSCQPGFDKAILEDYYEQFYWSNRDAIDGQHMALDDRPNDRQLNLTAERIAWIDQFQHCAESVIDFGAGDCAAAFTYKNKAGVCAVYVVDPSVRAGALAAKYGAGYSKTLDMVPVVDLIYSAHSIEHVADLIESFSEILAKVKVGGHIFFETPNIGDLQVFESLCHTPHTYMLSSLAFKFLETIFPVKIVGIECCGPAWKKNMKKIASAEKTDLRVLLQKTSEVVGVVADK